MARRRIIDMHHHVFPWYERAAALNMPVLFHLGVVARRDWQTPQFVDNNLMRPIYLDTIARAFPQLTIIGIFYDTAAALLRRAGLKL